MASEWEAATADEAQALPLTDNLLPAQAATADDDLLTAHKDLYMDKMKGYTDIHNFGLSHLKSSAIRCAVELGIPSVINHRGGAATISDIFTDTGIHTSKLPQLRRLLRVLAVCGILDDSPPVGDSTAFCYTLTPVSRLLVHDGEFDISPLLLLMTRPDTTVSTFFRLESWFKDPAANTPFEMAHGMSPWSLTKVDASYNDAMNDACVADSNLIMHIVLKEAPAIFRGLTSLIDVAGGHGIAAVAIAKEFPQITCTVLDLQQVIEKAPRCATVNYIVGDMFKFIPPADAVLLKAVLNSWEDDSCVKILTHCKRAIPAGGKLIIINTVIGLGISSNRKAVKEAQVLLDMYFMRGAGFEREEHEWRRVFLKAGFSGYKITPILDPVSIIEVFP